MSQYLIPPQDLLLLLTRHTDYLNQLTTFGARDLLEATQSLESPTEEAPVLQRAHQIQHPDTVWRPS
jgi:hypothetical protein